MFKVGPAKPVLPQIDEYFTIESSDNLTEGEILYEIARSLPDYYQIYEIFGNHIYFEGLSVTSNGRYRVDLGS
jgi:hypothetical protein